MPDGVLATSVSVALLLGVLAFAALRPRGLPEALVAVPAAGLVLALGLVSPDAALRQAGGLAPTLGFLAAVLVLAYLADVEGVFRWTGALLGRASRGGPRGLLLCTFAAAAGTTAVLSLDATVVLLTPVVLVTAASLRLPSAPHAYACAHLANSASTLFPVSNLTNLLVFGVSGLSFLGFTALMTLPWLVVLAVELLVFLWFFSGDLRAPEPAPPRGPAEHVAAPRFALAVLGAVLAGFAVSSPAGVAPVWVAAVGATALAARNLARGTVRPARLLGAAAPLFALFVLGLAVVVQAVAGHGLERVLAAALPASPDLAGLLGVASLAAVLANLVNNLPATLALLPVLGAHPHPGIALAVLLGVNIGPNASYVGSLATLLWRRVIVARGGWVSVRRFSLLGLCTVPVCLVAGVLALWLSLRVGGLG